MLSDGNVRIWRVDLVELNHTGHTIHRDIFARDPFIPTADPARTAFTALLSFALLRAPHYVFARGTFGRSRWESYFCCIDKSRATMFLTDRCDDNCISRSIDLRSMCLWVSAYFRSRYGLPTSVVLGRDLSRRIARRTRGEDSSERRWASRRRAPSSTPFSTHACAGAVFVQGDESFLMESLSIHLLSYHYNHRRVAAPLKYPD